MRRAIADWTAAALAVAILGIGGLVVIKPALDHWDDVYRADPFVVGTTTETVRKRLPAINPNKTARPRVSRTTTTTTENSSSFAERLLGKSGTVLLRLGLVALVAWLAAALLQRAILGNYALRIGAPVRTRKTADPALNVATPGADEAETAVVPAQNGDTTAPEPAGTANLGPAIAKLIASRREAMGLSQRELGKRAGISHTVISRIEGGEHSPSPKTLERLADALS